MLGHVAYVMCSSYVRVFAPMSAFVTYELLPYVMCLSLFVFAFVFVSVSTCDSWRD